MGNLNSCCNYGNHSTPRHIRDEDKKSGTKSNGHYRKSGAPGHGHPLPFDDANGLVSTHPGTGGLSTPKHEESLGNLQHISEREPDDWETVQVTKQCGSKIRWILSTIGLTVSGCLFSSKISRLVFVFRFLIR